MIERNAAAGEEAADSSAWGALRQRQRAAPRAVKARRVYRVRKYRQRRRREHGMFEHGRGVLGGFVTGLVVVALLAVFAPGQARWLLGLLPWSQSDDNGAGENANVAGGPGDTIGGAWDALARSGFDAVADSSATQAVSFAAVYAKAAPSLALVRVQSEPLEGLAGKESVREFSGVVVREDGYILTDGILFDDMESDGERASRIDVELPGGADYEAVVAGLDPQAGVAVLKIEATGLHAAYLGDSDAVRPGDVVAAIGSELCAEDATWITDGIVNGIYRYGTPEEGERRTLIQTSAAMSYSSIGGALVDGDGRVVGINSGGLSAMEGFEGLNCAIPVNEARTIAEKAAGGSVGALERHADESTDGGVAAAVPAAYSGISVDPSFDDNYELYKRQDPGAPRGAMVFYVEPLSGAFRAGVERGDIITRVGGTGIDSAGAFEEAMSLLAPGETAVIAAYRDGETLSFDVELSAPRGGQ